uniref:Uncharacterized protein n=1 Tax=Romanomermis culicivorax TaxID=13658 RepID=A0A915HH01_ROMCU
MKGKAISHGTACQIQCSQHKLMQYCNCTDPWESINADTVCLIHQKECVEAYYQNCNPLQAKPGQCPAKCEFVTY